MNVQNAKYLETGYISAEIDGVITTIPNDPRNRIYNEIIAMVDAGELSIISYADPEATSVDVKAEAGRRILEKLPAWQQSNLIAREAELIATEGGHLRDSNGVKLAARDLTNDEVGELVYIKTLWDWVKTVRAASGVIEQSPPAISELRTDNRWPADPS